MDKYKNKLIKAINYAIESDYEIYKKQLKINKRLEDAQNVCIFGTGGFFEGYNCYLKKYDYVIDNDENKIGKLFCGKECIQIDKLKKLEDVVVVIMIGNYKEVKKQLDKLGVENYIFYEIFLNVYTEYHNANWFSDNKNKILDALEFFEDDMSKEIYVELICNRIAPMYSEKTFHELEIKGEYMHKLSENECMLDAGAYDGDTIIKFIKQVKGKFNKIYGFELDKINYENMNENLTSIANRGKIILYNYGVSNCSKKINYVVSKTGSHVDNIGQASAEIVKIDDILSDKVVTFIKMDIEGSELEALEGAKEVICNNSPKLTISAYHKLEHLWEVPLFIKSLNSNYKLVLRHNSPLVWDTNCYAYL